MTEQTHELVGKLTLKSMGCQGAIVLVTKAKTPLARIVGIARNIKAATGNNGDPVFGLTGQFEGTNIQDGKIFKSAVAYLPNGILELILDPLEAVLNGEDKVAKANGIPFALDIFAVPDGNKAGYTFTAEIVGKNLQADPLAALKAQIGEQAMPKFPALPKA